MNISLNAEDFSKLTKGEIIEKDGVKIALQDISFGLMFDILDENFNELFPDTEESK